MSRSGWPSLASASDATLAAAMKTLIGSEGEAAPKQLVRRLTHAQYDNTVRDLLGDYSQPAERFPPEDYVDGFKNQLTGQGMPPLLVETYSTSAERLALNAFRIGDINGLDPVQAGVVQRCEVPRRVRARFGLRAFRRPLTDDEVEAVLGGVLASRRASSRRFFDGARVVVEAMLQSPNFLFHVEAGPGRQVLGLRRGEPPVVSAVEHDAGRCVVRGGREGRARHVRGTRARRAAHARECAEEPRRARSVLRRVAALRSRRQRGEVGGAIRRSRRSLRSQWRKRRARCCITWCGTIATSWKR